MRPGRCEPRMVASVASDRPTVLCCLVVVAGLMAGAWCASPARAAVLTYVDQDQVWVSTVDGTAKHAITSNGTADHPWSSPTSDDQGRILAARDTFLFLMDQTGATLPNGMNLAPQGPCGSTIGPAGAQIAPAGDWVAFWYFCNTYYPSSNIAPHVALALPQTFTLAGNQADWSDWDSPTWFGHRLVVSDGFKLFLQPAASDPPAPTAPEFGYAFAADDALALTRGVIARDGRHVLIDARPQANNDDQLELARLPAGPPASTDGVTNYIDQLCRVPTAGKPLWGSFSPDGSLIAWSDDGGVKVMSTPTYSGTGDCATAGSPTVISSTGRQAAFGGGAFATTSAPGRSRATR